MKKYKDIETNTPETFKRMTGLSKDNFQNLCYKVEAILKNEKRRNPLKKRGGFSIAKLFIFLTFLQSFYD